MNLNMGWRVARCAAARDFYEAEEGESGASPQAGIKPKKTVSALLGKRGITLFVSCLALGLLLPRSPLLGAPHPIQEGEMAGYLLVPNEKVPATYIAGFSIYVAAWPLLQQYPGSRFQTGLFGTWMFAQYQGQAPTNVYSDIEGGLGWWRDTRFATETPKFIMGGVAPNFIEWANGPGAGKRRDWDGPSGKYGVAQLSPWVLWPPDGLNLKQGTCGELFGYLPPPTVGRLADIDPALIVAPPPGLEAGYVPIPTRQAAKE